MNSDYKSNKKNIIFHIFGEFSQTAARTAGALNGLCISKEIWTNK